MEDIDTLTLTTAHAASSYGAPVLVIEGEAYGPADMTPAGVTGAELALTWAARFTGPRYGDYAAVLSQLGQLNAGDRALALYLVKRLLEVETNERTAQN
jgi:hypothetical protein